MYTRHIRVLIISLFIVTASTHSMDFKKGLYGAGTAFTVSHVITGAYILMNHGAIPPALQWSVMKVLLLSDVYDGIGGFVAGCCFNDKHTKPDLRPIYAGAFMGLLGGIVTCRGIIAPIIGI